MRRIDTAWIPLVAALGGVHAAAEALGVHWTTVYRWARGAACPGPARRLIEATSTRLNVRNPWETN